MMLLSAFFADLSVWDWADIVGLLLVFIGVVGEIVFHKINNVRWESISGYVLISGLALELIALPSHFKEAGEFKKTAGEANERAGIANRIAAEVESNNLALQLEVLKLKKELGPRRISEEQKKIMLDLFPRNTGETIILRYDFRDPEQRLFALEIAFTLLRAGYRVPEQSVVDEAAFLPESALAPPVGLVTVCKYAADGQQSVMNKIRAAFVAAGFDPLSGVSMKDPGFSAPSYIIWVRPKR